MSDVSKKRKIYLASPLFNEMERQRNKYIRDFLITDFDVFLPQEDGLLFDELISNGMPLELARKSVYRADILAMKNSDILLAVLDGANIDEGVAFELGYSKSSNKICIGLQTDIRRQLPTGNNPMIECSCDKIFSNLENIKAWLKVNF